MNRPLISWLELLEPTPYHATLSPSVISEFGKQTLLYGAQPSDSARGPGVARAPALPLTMDASSMEKHGRTSVLCSY